MAEGPLNESEMAWLEETLISYGHDDASVIDVSELDGMLTAVLSGPVVVEPDTGLVAVWGGEKYIPRWKNDREMNRFIDLCFKHMNDIAERLSEYPDQFEPLFGYNDVDGQSYTVVEEWCYGYMRGVALTDWSSLPEALEADLAVIALHGTEENSEKLEALTEEEYMASIESIQPAALRLYNYWVANPQQPEAKKPIVNGSKVGRNDPCPCGSGKKFKSCCSYSKKGLFIAPFYPTSGSIPAAISTCTRIITTPQPNTTHSSGLPPATRYPCCGCCWRLFHASREGSSRASTDNATPAYPSAITNPRG